MVYFGVGGALGINANPLVYHGKVALKSLACIALIVFVENGEAVIARQEWTHVGIGYAKRVMVVEHGGVGAGLVVVYHLFVCHTI